MNKLPVTVLSGFLGAGKTTLLNMDEGAIRVALDHALLTDAELELGPERWAFFEDPLPAWPARGA